ncbi:amidophosphoribosyltransferase [Leadbettera azotonutricia]|uniref:Amidophosphoribosyltransferase n=1 Tax=Leadbettera azotonutricia (strain ATCC BAA-888 / DSM 13862 / ZAS-9) TaxID=545695 RepID=F5YF13_LEAAZ|nr:amidophosphoribosyltransferase [Leadbettera azotonutricia]AEF82314.1 amidophosphoribosyltransferase [Leadbettera azotonutricia ZAS-9]
MKSSTVLDDIITDDKLHEECGVFGVYLNDPSRDAASLVYYGLLSLQHRGQESAGIAATKDKAIEYRKGMGLVSDVFTPEILEQIKGSSAVGHVRYSTMGSSTIDNAQPFVSRFKLGSIAVAHNGTLTNANVVRELLEDAGIGFTSSSDSEVIVNLIAKNYKKGLERALTDTIQFIKGSYALAVLTDEVLVGARDPNGIRPLCLGQLDGGWILASESCAIDAIGGKFVRDIEPGEVVIIGKDQVLTFSFSEKTRRAVCSFEYVYFARPDSIIDKVDVYGARIRAGEILGRESAVAADLVIGVPDSGIPAAIGYGRATKTPYGLGIVKSKYVGRTFISPNQIQREKAVSVKHNVIASEVKDKRVVIIDDSIVRGTTSRRLVAILKGAGAKEVHIRVCSPPVRCPCYFGIDTPHRKDLISNGNSVSELCRSLGADSLAFISVEGLLEALDGQGGYCLGCFTGEYPIPVPGEAGDGC